jgi:hypothetical protein
VITVCEASPLLVMGERSKRVPPETLLGSTLGELGKRWNAE